MPSQSRGYWSCDYCGMEGFDTFEDANAHEIDDCPQRKRPAEPRRHEVYQPQSIVPYTQQQQQQQQQLPQHQMMETPPEPVDYSEEPRYQAPPPQYYPRRIQLLTQGTLNDLSSSDAATCSSIEVMEATPDLVNAANVRRSERTMVSPGQVVMRCIQCVHNPATVHSTPQIFPSSISSMASSVRSLQDHLRVCPMIHDDIKRAIGPAMAKGRRAIEEDERDRVSLIEYCTYFCRREGIFNKHPPNTGIVFSEVEEFWSPSYGHPESGQGTPSTYTPQYAPPQRPGPLGSAGTMGGDPIAATPMPSRRGRPPFYSDRSEGYPPSQPPYSAGYAFTGSPYTPQYSAPPHPESVQYSGRERSYGIEGAQTPGYPSRYEQSIEYTPEPARAPPEASPPTGYIQSYDVPHEFPFSQDPGGSWECKFCNQIHPQYRDPQAIWSAPGGTPPPGPFIDQHLSMCRAYNSLPPTPSYSGPPTPYPYIPIHSQSQYPYGWDAPGQPLGPPPEHQDRSPTRPDMPPSLQAPQPHPHTPYAQLTPPPPPHQREITPRRATDQPIGIQSTPRSLGQTDPMPGDREVERAKVFLAAADRDVYGGPLVLDEDKLLLTDYFFHLMKQLKLCRFSESDRKTRGGKRDRIRIGYGGLQCVHCSDTPNGRKFFWSNVDRLANSFAEIPGHLFKCRRCPQPLKDALLQLKARHPEQMARLPRGSQKVFFRRMWRRLHDEDPPPVEGEEVTPAKEESKDMFSPSLEGGDERGNETANLGDDTPQRSEGEPPTPATSIEASAERAARSSAPEGAQVKPPLFASAPGAEVLAAAAAEADSSPATSGSESVVLIERTSQEAAKALASTDLEHTAPPSPSSRVLLAIPEDKEWLSDMDCFIRRQVEVFCASTEDVLAARSDRKYPVGIGQIGIRCIHCALSKPRFGARGTAVAFPFAVSGIFESVRELGRMHLESCDNMPKSVKERLLSFKGSTSLSSVLRKYYVHAAIAIGLYDTPEGIRAGAESVPLGSQAAFAFSPESSQLSEQLRLERGAAGAKPGETQLPSPSTMLTPMESRKRKQPSPAEEKTGSGAPKKDDAYDDPP